MSLPVSWGTLYGNRKTIKYKGEKNRYTFDHKNVAGFVDSLFELDEFSLDPPPSLSHTGLRNILKQASILPITDANRRAGYTRPDIYIDDRKSNLDEPVAGELDSLGKWDGHIGKHAILKIDDFYNYVTSVERHEAERKCERRMIYAASPCGDALLTLLASCARRTMPIILQFLQQYIDSQAPSEIFLSSTKIQYSIGFELCYWALRKGPPRKDQRTLFGRPLRISKPLPLGEATDKEQYHYYEAKVSYLVTGVDDYLFATYLLVDTYHGEVEAGREDYADAYQGKGLDPASMRTFEFPFWNPREHMFAALASRLCQVSKAEIQTIKKFDERMRRYEEEHTTCFDTREQSETQNLSSTVDTLRDLRTSVRNIILAWTKFRALHLDWLQTTEYKALYKSLRLYQKDIERYIAILETYHQRLDDRYEQFDGRLNRIMLASSQRHNANVESLQELLASVGRNAHVVAGVAFCLVGLSFVSSLFGMNMVSDKTNPGWAIGSLCSVALISYWLTNHPEVLTHFFPVNDKVDKDVHSAKPGSSPATLRSKRHGMWKTLRTYFARRVLRRTSPV